LWSANKRLKAEWDLAYLSRILSLEIKGRAIAQAFTQTLDLAYTFPIAPI
jgi:hypothetical protein